MPLVIKQYFLNNYCRIRNQMKIYLHKKAPYEMYEAQSKLNLKKGLL